MTAGGNPEGWVSARVEELFDWWGGMTPSTTIDAYWGGTTPWVSSKDLKSHGVNADTEMVTDRALRETRLRRCRPGTLLTVVRSGVLAHTLPVAIADRAVVINQDLKAFDSGDDDVNRWLATYLRAHEREILEENRKDGTTVQSIRVEQLVKREIPVPPIAEQVRIMEKVEALLTQVSAARARLERVPRILKRFRQAVLAAACDGRLTEGWRECPETTSWMQSALGDVLIEPMANGHSVRDNKGGFPVLRLTALRHGRVDLRERKEGQWTLKEAGRFLVKQGDFLVARGNGSLRLVGRGGLVDEVPDPVAYPDTLIRVRPDPSRMSPEFLRVVWDAPPVRSQLEGVAHTSAGIHKVSQSDLGGIELPLPPVEEQQEIVRRVQGLFSLADTIERRVTAALARTDKLPQAILSRAFAGELVPPEAARAEGRSYETAEDLLERIRGVREGAKAVPGARKAAVPGRKRVQTAKRSG